MIRKNNPSISIFVLFGGAGGQSQVFAEALHGLYDDFWVFDGEPPAAAHDTLDGAFRGGNEWKWYYGDLLLLEWYKKRGTALVWDTVFVVQWDMLVYGRIDGMFPGLKKDQTLFSGLRPVSEVEQAWDWTSPLKPNFRKSYLEFLEYTKTQFGRTTPPMCCLAIVMALPRIFFERFAAVPHPEIGFIEYKLPTYADLFQIETCRPSNLDVWWDDLEPHSWRGTLHAGPIEIEPLTMVLERMRPRGKRIFHPYLKSLPENTLGWLHLLMKSTRRILRATARQRAAGNPP